MRKIEYELDLEEARLELEPDKVWPPDQRQVGKQRMPQVFYICDIFINLFK